MRMKNLILLLLVFVCTLGAVAQAPPAPQSLTFWYEYWIKPGKEAAFTDLIKQVGAPVRDKAMADGVVQAWGMEHPLLRNSANGTHLIWFNVKDWAGVEKVQNAMAAQLARIAADEAKAAPGKKTGMTTAERSRDIIDVAKTRDWLTRDLVSGFSEAMPPAGYLPYTRYNFIKVKPGKGSDYRQTWEKYNKPVLDKLLKDGAIDAYGLAVEEVRTEGTWTHFVWIGMKDLSGLDKLRTAFTADREARSAEEQRMISETFNNLTDGDANRQMVTHSSIFKLPEMKK